MKMRMKTKTKSFRAKTKANIDPVTYMTHTNAAMGTKTNDHRPYHLPEMQPIPALRVMTGSTSSPPRRLKSKPSFGEISA
mmetsp:Transcript_6529/g.9327  ORF Transcript_6529/g.9327 Transcript_6529/m.9327 type:complete len:80 (+) Transcript_6529:284-523(+)